MATIRKREGKKGTSYQVQVRLKGGEMETASFKSLTKAGSTLSVRDDSGHVAMTNPKK